MLNWWKVIIVSLSAYRPPQTDQKLNQFSSRQQSGSTRCRQFQLGFRVIIPGLFAKRIRVMPYINDGNHGFYCSCAIFPDFCLIAGAVFYYCLSGWPQGIFLYLVKKTSIKYLREFIKFTVLTDYHFEKLSSILVQLVLTSNQRPLFNQL